MASMGDDQEENIEMWKIKKVRAPPRGFFVFCFLSLSERRALLVLVVFNDDDDDDDDVFLRRKPRDDVVSFRSLSLSLSLSLSSATSSLFFVRERPNGVVR